MLFKSCSFKTKLQWIFKALLIPGKFKQWVRCDNTGFLLDTIPTYTFWKSMTWNSERKHSGKGLVSISRKDLVFLLCSMLTVTILNRKITHKLLMYKKSILKPAHLHESIKNKWKTTVFWINISTQLILCLKLCYQPNQEPGIVMYSLTKKSSSMLLMLQTWLFLKKAVFGYPSSGCFKSQESHLTLILPADQIFNILSQDPLQNCMNETFIKSWPRQTL